MPNKYTILVVEDTATVQKILEFQLKKQNYNVILAENGIEGLKKLSENNIDLIISDVMMPKMDGFEFCKRVKQHDKFKKLPFIMLTAKAFLDDKLQGLQYGADKYIYKPYNYEKLSFVIKDLLENKSRFKFTLHGENWYEFHIQKSTNFVNEINEIIKNICWENKKFISEIDSIIFSINIIKNKLLESIKDSLNITFSYKYNKEKIMLKLEGFPNNYLKDKLTALNEIKHFVTNINVNSTYDKLLLTKVVDSITETSILEDELLSLNKELNALDDKLKNISEGNVKNSDKIIKVENNKKADEMILDAADAAFSFIQIDDKVEFSFTPAQDGGKKVGIQDIKNYVKDKHYVGVSYQLIKSILEDNKESKKIVAHNQYKKDCDGSVKIEYDDFKSKAYMIITQPPNPNGKKVNYKYAYEIIQLYNFIEPKIKDLKQFFINNDNSDKILIAEGTAPEKGEDEKINYFVFDVFDNKEVLVKPGQLLLYKSSGKIGKAGVDVFGNIIPPLKIKDLNIEYDSNIFTDKKNLRFVAGCEGKVKFENNKLELIPKAGSETKINKYDDIYKYFIIKKNDVITYEKNAPYILICKNNNIDVVFFDNEKNYIKFFEYKKVFIDETDEKVKSKALKYFNVSTADKLNFNILQSSSKGVLGMMKKEAKFEISLKNAGIVNKDILLLKIELSKNKFNDLKKEFDDLKNLFNNSEDDLEKEKLKSDMTRLKNELKSILNKIQDIKNKL